MHNAMIGRIATLACTLLALPATATAWPYTQQPPADDKPQAPPATAPAQPPPAQSPAQPAADPMMMDGPAAHTSPASAPTPTPAAADSDVLAGPAVADATARTLIRLDAAGRFQRVEGRPDEAALIILDLDPETRELARQAAAARRETLRSALLENLDLIIAGSDALTAGERDKAADLMRQMRDRIDPTHARDPVLIAISPILPNEQQAELAALVDAYWAACIDWELRNAKDQSEAARQRVQDRIGFDLFQREISQAYERTLRPYRAKLEALVSATAPTDEQKAAMREILLDLIRAGGLEPTPQQQQEAARRIYQTLDEERRQKLFELAFNRL